MVKELPEEVLNLIIEYSFSLEIIKLNSVCSSWRQTLSNNIEIWRHLLKHDFRTLTLPPPELLESNDVEHIRACYFSARKQRFNPKRFENIYQKKFKNDDFKTIILGKSRVGKTSMVMQYLNNIFPEICFGDDGDDSYRKYLQLKDILPMESSSNLFLKLCDIVGEREQNNDSSLQSWIIQEREEWMQQCDFVIMVFDFVDHSSIEYLRNNVIPLWHRKIKERKNKSDVFAILVGNKYDLISDEKNNNNTINANDEKSLESIRKEIQQLKEENSISDYMEISAKTNFNVKQMFEECIRVYFNSVIDWEILIHSQKETKKGCYIM